LVRYTHLHVGGATIDLMVDSGSAMLTWQTLEPGLDAVDHVGDGAIATLHNVMGELCGTDWRLSEARFAHRRPADVGPFRRFFRVPLHFDDEESEMRATGSGRATSHHSIASREGKAIFGIVE
jgi:hypothetical protein